LAKLAADDPAVYARVKATRNRQGRVVTAASTLTEVLRGGPRDARVHRALSRITVVPIGEQQGRAAGELLGRCGLSGHRCALDALLAVVALGQARPVVLLTSDPSDLGRLTEELEIRKEQRILVARV
jgi:predicted nucleic acid-binding protein